MPEREKEEYFFTCSMSEAMELDRQYFNAFVGNFRKTLKMAADAVFHLLFAGEQKNERRFEFSTVANATKRQTRSN